MNIVFGKYGQVARCLADVLDNTKWRFVGSGECNFEKPEEVLIFLNNLTQKPSIIINAAAYTAVDLAESEQQKAMNVNGESVGVIAKFCKENNVVLFHYSTDYVFDGTKSSEYTTNDMPNPINFYGVSKLLGEQKIIESNCKHYILRTSWVYSKYGKNFLKTMLKLIQEREEISVVSDQVGSPTSAMDIAQITNFMLNSSMPCGIYHFTNEGFCSWYEFACEIAKIAKLNGISITVQNIKAILTKDYPTPAKRPINSMMNKGALKPYIKPWKDSLASAMMELN